MEIKKNKKKDRYIFKYKTNSGYIEFIAIGRQ